MTTTIESSTHTTATTASQLRISGRAAPRSARIGGAPLMVWLAGLTAVLLLIASFAPGLLATHEPRTISLENPLAPPSWDHWFGTDASGRDMYSRMVHGTGQSLLIGLGATGIGVGLAVIFGAWAGLGGRGADAVIGRGLEVLFAFPTLLLAMVFITVYGPSAPTLVLAVGLGTAPGYTRMVRGQVWAIRHSGYVQAAQALGHSPWRILCRHVLPNALRPLLAVLTLGIGQSIVWASGLAFLGFGVAPPASEWGRCWKPGAPTSPKPGGCKSCPDWPCSPQR